MPTIYVSPRETLLVTIDGLRMAVKIVKIREKDDFVNLQDWRPPPDLKDIEIVLVKKIFCRKLRLPSYLKLAMLNFFQTYHAKQNIDFDCYAFANTVKSVESHKVTYMLRHWVIKALPWRLGVGYVVFFRTDNIFHHAAVYIGSNLYISVWGAGGDLEIASLKAMKRDYGAKEVVLAQPK